MSAKEGHSRFEKTNYLVESYHRDYIETPKLDLSALNIEKLESLLFSIAHAHDLMGKQVQDLSSGN